MQGTMCYCLAVAPLPNTDAGRCSMLCRAMSCSGDWRSQDGSRLGPARRLDSIRVPGWRRLTPTLTPTPVNSGELPRTLDRQNRAIQAPACTSLNVPERTAAGSKTAGCRCDSCPTCPRSLNSWGLYARVYRCRKETTAVVDQCHCASFTWRCQALVTLQRYSDRFWPALQTQCACLDPNLTPT